MTNKSHETPSTPDAGSISRRTALIQSATGAVAVALAGCATSMKVQGNESKMDAQYQDRPRGLARCGLCKHFIPANGCEIVVAPVQANGWCQHYALF
jgi:hypothetical protein